MPTLCQHWDFASINSIKTTDSSVSKSEMVVPTLKQPYTNIASINNIETTNFSVYKSGMVVPTLYQHWASIVVAVYRMLSKGGGGGAQSLYFTTISPALVHPYIGLNMTNVLPMLA